MLISAIIVGGLLFSLTPGDGLAIEPSGLIGPIVITAAWQFFGTGTLQQTRAAAKKAAPSGRHH